MRKLQLHIIQLSKSRDIFNIFECGKNILNKIYATYERACMVTPRDKYHTKMHETLVYYNDCNDAPLSNEKL